MDTYQHKQECRPDRYDGRPESGGLPRKTDFENYESTADDFVNEMDYMATAKLVSKRRNYVSYVLSTYEYTGGAHGMKLLWAGLSHKSTASSMAGNC